MPGKYSTGTLHVQQVCGTYWQALECDTNYSPLSLPITLSLLLTPLALSVTIANNK